MGVAAVAGSLGSALFFSSIRELFILEKELVYFGVLKLGLIDPGPISKLPQELISEIFSYLNPPELAKCFPVSKAWKMIASEKWLWDSFDLKKVFPKLQVLDEKIWRTSCNLTALEISIDDAPLHDNRFDIPAFARFLISLKGKTEEDTEVTLLTSSKGLTFNKLMTFASNPLQGRATGCRYVDPSVLRSLGNIPIEKTYRVIITNSVFKNCRNRSLANQKKLVHEGGCRLPGMLEIATLAHLTNVTSSGSLYRDKLNNYILCVDKIDGFYVDAGGFEPSDLRINLTRDDRHDFFAVAGLQDIDLLASQK